MKNTKTQSITKSIFFGLCILFSIIYFGSCKKEEITIPPHTHPTSPTTSVTPTPPVPVVYTFTTKNYRAEYSLNYMHGFSFSPTISFAVESWYLPDSGFKFVVKFMDQAMDSIAYQKSLKQLMSRRDTLTLVSGDIFYWKKFFGVANTQEWDLKIYDETNNGLLVFNESCNCLNPVFSYAFKK